MGNYGKERGAGGEIRVACGGGGFDYIPSAPGYLSGLRFFLAVLEV